MPVPVAVPIIFAVGTVATPIVTKIVAAYVETTRITEKGKTGRVALAAGAGVLTAGMALDLHHDRARSQKLSDEIRQAEAVGDTARAQELRSTLDYLLSHPGVSRKVVNKLTDLIPRPRRRRARPPAEESAATDSAGSPDTADSPSADPPAAAAA